jgi:glycosyltransferase involved in cell wall biosynthesis
MKIAMLTTVGERCGIASYSAALVASLRTLPETDVEVIPIAVGEQPASHYEAQAERLNAADVDVVHIQHEFSFWGFPTPRRSKFAELRRMIRRPLVVTAHTPLSLSAIFPTATERNPWRWLKKKRLVSNRTYRESVEVSTFDANATIVHTEAAHTEFLRRGLQSERLFVVPMGIPSALPAAAGGARFRDRFGLHHKRLLTLFGYVTPNKGYAMVAEVLKALPADVVFVVAGGARRPVEEQYVQQVRQHARELGVEKRVIVTGYLPDEDVAEVMQATDIALVPHTQATNSYSVTLPVTYGKPTLASDLSCFREMAARSDCLELFRTGSKSDFREKLLALLANPQRREQLAANALHDAARFTWPNVASTTRDVYRTAIDGHGGARH